jgi:hypothetical protein
VNQRAFACALAVLVSCLVSLGVPGPADAQQPASPRRIGVLLVGTPPESMQVRGFIQGLKDAGYVEGRDVVIEWRSSPTRSAVDWLTACRAQQETSLASRL